MTAFVILIADKTTGNVSSDNGIILSLNAFGNLLGNTAYYIIGASVILFAFATLIAQIYYADVAIGYFTKSKIPRVIFVFISSVLCYIGATMHHNSIWLVADIIIGVMTVINTSILLILRNQIKELIPTRML